MHDEPDRLTLIYNVKSDAAECNLLFYGRERMCVSKTRKILKKLKNFLLVEVIKTK